MKLSNLFIMMFHNLKKSFMIFVGFWFIIGLLLFIPSSSDVILFTLLILFITSNLFSLFMGIIVYGKFGKTFVLIQNNRKTYTIISIIIGLITSLLLTLISAFLRLNSYDGQFNPFNIKLGISLFLYFLAIYNIGGLYGLFVCNNSKIKKVFFYILGGIIILFGYFILPLLYDIVIHLIEFNNNNSMPMLIPICGIMSIGSICVCSIYYLKLSIIKAYSPE